MDTQSMDQIFQFVRKIILHLGVSDIFMRILPEEHYNVSDFESKFFPECRLWAEPIEDYDYELKDVQMVRFSPAMLDISEIHVMPDKSLFFQTDLAFQTETGKLADLLEREKAVMSPFEPTSNYNYNQLSMEDFPLPLITRTYEPPLRHLVLLSSGDDELSTFSRAAEMYYITPKEAALCFLGELERAFVNLAYMSQTYEEKEKAQLKEAKKTAEECFKYSRSYLFTKRRETRESVIIRLEGAADRIRRKEHQIDANAAIFAKLSSVHSLTPIWTTISVLLNVQHIRVLSPIHAGLLRGSSAIAIAACNCGYFIAPIFTSRIFNFDCSFYQNAIFSGVDKRIYEQLAQKGFEVVNSENYQVELRFSLIKKEAEGRSEFFKFREEERPTFIHNEEAVTKRVLFSKLQTNTEGFENFNAEFSAKYVPTEFEELECNIDGSACFSEKSIVIELRRCQLQDMDLPSKVHEIVGNFSIYEILVASGWALANEGESPFRIVVEMRRDNEQERGIIENNKFTPSEFDK